MRDFTSRHDEPSDDLFVALPKLEAKKALFPYVAGVRGKRQRRRQAEMTLMFVDVKETYIIATCGEVV